MTGVEVLNIPMNPDTNDAKASSIREYLKLLLRTLWIKGEEFNGKRPFGNSAWEYEIYYALRDAGISDGSNHDRLIFDAIEAL